MADTKISALASASTPLAGTEVLPIVQSGATVKVAVSDLTAGRAVSGLSLSLTGSGPVSQFNTGNTNSVRQQYINSGGTFQVGLDSSGGAIFGTAYAGVVWHNANYPIVFGVNNAEVARFNTSGNLAFPSGKGIDFSAASHAAGMTSELLNDYEEGTWTPTIAGDSVAGTQTYLVQVGRYTKVGNRVYFNARIVLSAKDAATAGNIMVSGLPFTPNSTSSDFHAVAVGNAGLITLTALYTQLEAHIEPNLTNIYLGQIGSGLAYSYLQAAAIANTTRITVSGHYDV